jgi:hypothetical protein
MHIPGASGIRDSLTKFGVPPEGAGEAEKHQLEQKQES